MKSFSLLAIFYFFSAAFGKGCVQFDKYTFDKIISRFEAALIKFDSAYPFGPKHEAFEVVCEDSTTAPDLIVGEVQVKDYGEKDNEDLAQKYGVEKSSFPTVLLFVKGKSEPVPFKESDDFPFNAVNLKKFIKTHAKLYIGLPGCLKEFDLLVKKFSKEQTLQGKKKLLSEAEALKKKVQTEKNKKSADTYIKIMKKIVEKGDTFVETESTRVENVLKGKLNKQKMEEMQERINILGSFKEHDEL
ncbi:endoplasmic reticulum resident protein 29 [Cimex lectularius]|uniref:Endoplasmic reticulum resident protein 29 n=1 Tax=Cimex lectularius TaxID=79782 RepID=A0A8I6RHX8_CIMLE|nr:endoplasmic reticulum resident protein 29 [Cimex lectularius]